MSRFSSLRVKLVVVTVIFLTIAPTLGMTFNTDEARDLIWLADTLGFINIEYQFFRNIRRHRHQEGRDMWPSKTRQEHMYG